MKVRTPVGNVTKVDHLRGGKGRPNRHWLNIIASIKDGLQYLDSH